MANLSPREKAFEHFDAASEFVASLNVSNPTCQICMYQNGVEWMVTWFEDEDLESLQMELV